MPILELYSNDIIQTKKYICIRILIAVVFILEKKLEMTDMFNTVFCLIDGSTHIQQNIIKTRRTKDTIFLN